MPEQNLPGSPVTNTDPMSAEHPGLSKACRSCGAVKPLSDYYQDRRAKDGKESSCKECQQVQQAQRRRGQREVLAARAREYRRRQRERIAAGEIPEPERKSKPLTPAQRKRRAERVARYQAAHPEKREAHIAVMHEIRMGRLQRADACDGCGQSVAELRAGDRLEAHHDDYNKPLEVRWLCRRCHAAVHR